MMRWVLLAILALGPLGCGGDEAPPEGSKALVSEAGPHRGPSYALPDNLGFVEVLAEPLGVGSLKKAPEVVLAVYFLGPDRKAALSPSPTDVKIVAHLPGEDAPRTITLSASPKPGDPAGGLRFASATGPYDLDELRGEVQANVADKPVSVPFSFR